MTLRGQYRSFVAVYVRPADSESMYILEKLVGGVEALSSHSVSSVIIAGNFNARLDQPNSRRTTAYGEALANYSS